jgi:undecaprenyl diphosphate synthase
MHQLPTFEGHAHGYEALKKIITVVHAEHIPHMVCYAFSTENWKRTEEEVGYLMTLMHHALRELSDTFKKDARKINVRVIGEITRLPHNIQNEITRIIAQNYTEPELTVWMAISYGGRAEIVDAVNRAITTGQKVTEESLESFLWTNGMPDPDLIIRTSGEQRTSNFLIWQSAYSELFFTETLWPDFGETEFKSILENYATRQRRRGT